MHKLFSKNQTIPVSHLVKLASLKNQERRVKDSPYTSSYASKAKRKAKDGSTKDLNKSSEKGKWPRCQILALRVGLVVITQSLSSTIWTDSRELWNFSGFYFQI